MNGKKNFYMRKNVRAKVMKIQGCFKTLPQTNVLFSLIILLPHSGDAQFEVRITTAPLVTAAL